MRSLGKLTLTTLVAAALLMSAPSVLAQDDPYGMDLPIDPSHYQPAPNPQGQPLTTAPGDLPGGTTDPGHNGGDDPPPDDDPPTFFGEDIPSQDSIIYVIDRSSSMWLMMSSYVDSSGQTHINPSRFDVARAELKQSIARLSENFSFNVFFYHECISSWQPSRVDATDDNKQQAMNFIDAMAPAGWTNTGIAVSQALQDQENTTILLLSDGAPNYLDCSQTMVGSFDDHAQIIRDSNVQQASVNCFGIGLSDQARTFLNRVAAENNGIFVEIN